MRWSWARISATATRQATVLAPTGTIGFMMDCDTTGVEPDIALVKYKKLVGGGMMKIVNQTVPMALKRLGYTADADRRHRQATSTSRRRSKARRTCWSETCRCSTAPSRPARGERSIHYMGHIKMMGAAQPFISGAIRKTVNVPKDATVEDIEQAYIESWRLGAEGDRDLPRRLQAHAAAQHLEGRQGAAPLPRRQGRGRRRRRRGAGGAHADAPEAAGRAAGHHPQVRHRGPRGLHHRRPVRGRDAGRDLPGHGQGRLDDLGLRWTRSPRPSATRCSTACRCRRWSTSSATCASSRRG